MNPQEKCSSKAHRIPAALVAVLMAGVLALGLLYVDASGKVVDVPKIAEQCMPSSVIFQVSKLLPMSSETGGVEEELVSEGATGWIWSDEGDELLIVTNNHVVEGTQSIRIRLSPEKAQGILLPAETLGRDDTADIAVVSIKKSDIPKDILGLVYPATLGDADKVRLGEPAILIGNSLAEGQNVSCGVISAVDRRLDNGAFQREVFVSDAAINFGNSGSMLLNRNGEVIGVNTSKNAKDNSEGMGYYSYTPPFASDRPVEPGHVTQTTI